MLKRIIANRLSKKTWSQASMLALIILMKMTIEVITNASMLGLLRTKYSISFLDIKFETNPTWQVSRAEIEKSPKHFKQKQTKQPRVDYPEGLLN